MDRDSDTVSTAVLPPGSYEHQELNRGQSSSRARVAVASRAALPAMSVFKAISKAKEVGNLKSTMDWLRVLADGSLFVALFEKGPTGRLVGTDQFGNRYFEDNETTYNRKRWVLYKDMSQYNPTSITPEWHGW